MAQYTIDLPCIADTYIDEGAPSTNYGTATTLQSGWSSSGVMRSRTAFLKFNNALLPTNKKIISTQLRLYLTQSLSIATGQNFYIYKVTTKDWIENTLTYNNSEVWFSNMVSLTGVGYAANYYIDINIPVSANVAYKPDYGIAPNPNQDGAILYFQSREGANPPVLRITYEDVPPDAPTPKDPIGDFKDNKSVVRFEWTYNSSVGGTQKAFDLQWSTDQTTWTTVSQTTANNYYDMPADTLPAGNIYWRVRCYNEYDEASVYCSTQSFYAIGAPAAPILNTVPTNSARPVITWAAFNQQVYQLQILSGTTVVYDSGDQPSISIRSHKVMAFLADGAYTAKLRIKNEYDLWSTWGEATFTVSTVKPAKPALTVVNTAYGLRAKASLKDVDYALLYRDGVCVKKQAEMSIIDNRVRNGNTEEGVGHWDVGTGAELSIENNKFKIVAGQWNGITQVIDVKPNTNYRLIANVTGDGAQCIVTNLEVTVQLGDTSTYFNTGNITQLKVVIRTISAGTYTLYADSIMLIEGTTAPTVYKSYMEDYIINDNAVVNATQYDYTARVVQDIPERSITNLLGPDGDCEDISKWTSTGAIASSTEQKKYGSGSFKSSSVGTGGGVQNDNYQNVVGKYYFLSIWVYVEAYTSGVFGAQITDNLSWNNPSRAIAVTTTIGAWQRVGEKVPGRDKCRIVFGDLYGNSIGTVYCDGGILNEISEEDYNTLTTDQLMQKYPFGNNTFTASAYEVYNESDPVTKTAEVKNTLIAPVSDMTDVFAFTRSLNTPPKRLYDRNPVGASILYSGRQYPVSEPTEHTTTGLSVTFFLKTYAEVEIFIAMYDLNETVLYRDARGRKIYGTLSNLSVSDERSGYVISFIISQVDYNEEVEV